jgi:hypothetical protein
MSRRSDADPALLQEYRRVRGLARWCFADLVEALNRRDSFHELLNHARHPLAPERIEWLTAELTLARHRAEHAEQELTDYDYRLQRLERQLGLDDAEPRDMTAVKTPPKTPEIKPPAQAALFRDAD